MKFTRPLFKTGYAVEPCHVVVGVRNGKLYRMHGYNLSLTIDAMRKLMATPVYAYRIRPHYAEARLAA